MAAPWSCHQEGPGVAAFLLTGDVGAQPHGRSFFSCQLVEQINDKAELFGRQLGEQVDQHRNGLFILGGGKSQTDAQTDSWFRIVQELVECGFLLGDTRPGRGMRGDSQEQWFLSRQRCRQGRLRFAVAHRSGRQRRLDFFDNQLVGGVRQESQQNFGMPAGLRTAVSRAAASTRATSFDFHLAQAPSARRMTSASLSLSAGRNSGMAWDRCSLARHWPSRGRRKSHLPVA